jgi:arsenate reductase-like glutaredoxin family protein
MKKELITKEQVFNKMCEMAENNILSIQKQELADACSTYASNSRFAKAIQELEDLGKIKLIQKASRNGQRYWSNFVWEIVEEKESTNSTISKINVNDYKEELFHDIPMKLYKVENSYVIPVSCIYKALELDKQLFSQLIKSNYELFQPWLVNVILTSQKSGNKNLCLTRDGVIGVLMKISYKRLSEDKQKLVLDFQKWAIEKLTTLISNGEVKLLEQEHSQIQNQVGNIVGMSEEEIDKLFSNMTDEVIQIVNTAKVSIKKIQKEKEQIEYEKEILKKENQRWINNTLALKEKIYQLNSL